MIEIKTFKYLFNLHTKQPVKKFIGKVRIIHGKLLDMTEEDLHLAASNPSRNVYQLLRDWSLDVLQLGVVITFIYSAFAGWQGILGSLKWILAFGMALWALTIIIKEIGRAIKEI